MKLNDLEAEFFDRVLNADLGVPVHATLVYQDNTFVIITVPEITPDGYFILKYFNAPAYVPETRLIDSRIGAKRYSGSEICGTHALLERAWLDRDLVTVQLHTSPRPLQPPHASVNPKLDARVLYAGTEHRGQLALDKNQVAVQHSQLIKAEFCIVDFPGFVTPDKQWNSISEAGKPEIKAHLQSIASKLGDDAQIIVRPPRHYVNLDSGDGWTITLTEDKERTRDLLSHSGAIARICGSEFGTDELHDLLEGLKCFFAFTAGAYCHPTVVIGYDTHKQPIWGQVGLFDKDLQNPANWFKNSNNAPYGAYLEWLFPRFWCKWREKRNEIIAVIECYVHSNAMTRAGVAKDAVAKSYAGLEILASLVAAKTIGGGSSQEIHRVLSDCQIPNSLLTKDLAPIMTRLCRDLGVKEKQGAHLLGNVRNYVAHPLDRDTSAEIKEKHVKYLDADDMNYVRLHDLCQFYLEYLFLRFCGFEVSQYRQLQDA